MSFLQSKEAEDTRGAGTADAGRSDRASLRGCGCGLGGSAVREHRDELGKSTELEDFRSRLLKSEDQEADADGLRCSGANHEASHAAAGDVIETDAIDDQGTALGLRNRRFE